MFCWSSQWVDGGVDGACFLGAASESAAVLYVLVLLLVLESAAVLLVLVSLGRPVGRRRYC